MFDDHWEEEVCEHCEGKGLLHYYSHATVHQKDADFCFHCLGTGMITVPVNFQVLRYAVQ